MGFYQNDIDISIAYKIFGKRFRGVLHKNKFEILCVCVSMEAV